jgi:hypothetical protein
MDIHHARRFINPPGFSGLDGRASVSKSATEKRTGCVRNIVRSINAVLLQLLNDLLLLLQNPLLFLPIYDDYDFPPTELSSRFSIRPSVRHNWQRVELARSYHPLQRWYRAIAAA